MYVTRAQLLLVCFIGALPALVIVGMGWKARVAPLKVAVEAIPALNLLVFALAIVLPVSSGTGAALIAIGAILGALGVFNAFRGWRRSKAPAPPRNE